MSLALAHCKAEDVNTTVSGRDTRTPLHLAAALGNLPITQLLIWVTQPPPIYHLVTNLLCSSVTAT